MPMNVLRVAVIGFGVVGRGFAKALLRRRRTLAEEFNLNLEVVAISDLKWGSVYDEDGLDLERCLSIVESGGSLEDYPSGVKGLSSLETIREAEYDVMVELTPTNVETGEPGLTHIAEALRMGRHVVTTNKGPISLAYWDLTEMAEERGVSLRFEGTVMSGTPVLSLLREGLGGDLVEEVYGILNGTNNFILTQMEAGKSFEEALREAQRLGYAEADPTMDVEGWDAAAKAAIIANAVMGGRMKPQDVRREGITGVTSEEVVKAVRDGKRVKHVARVWREGGRVYASVAVEKLPLSHPLSTVTGVKNALVARTENLGEVFVTGPGAGGVETGQAVLSDVLAIYRLHYR